MIARGIVLLSVFTWLIATALAFLVISARSDAAPLGTAATVTVTTWDGDTSASELNDLLAEFAATERISFAKEVPDFAERATVRHLYLVAGDADGLGSRLLDGGMDDFGGSVTTHVHPFAELGDRSPVGNYDVFGDPANARRLQGFLSSHGTTAISSPVTTTASIGRPTALLAAVYVLLIVAVVAAFGVSHTRAYAVARLQGLSRVSMLLADCRRFAPPWAVAGAASLLAAAALGALRYGTGGVPAFLSWAAMLGLAFTAIAVATLILVLLMATSIEIQPALKGELPTGALTVLAYGLRLSAVVVTLGTTAATLSLAADVTERDRSADAFARLGTLSSVSLGSAYTPEDEAALFTAVGPWLREADRAGELLLAAQQALPGTDPAWRGVTALYVNEAFLQRQPVHLAGGGRLTEADPNRITVVVPEHFGTPGASLLDELDLTALMSDTTTAEPAWSRSVARQQVFTFAPTGQTATSATVWDTRSATLTDPVIVVMPSARQPLSDSSYASFASQSGALLERPEDAAAAVSADPGLGRFVRGVTPVADSAAATLALQTSELHLASLTAVIGCIVIAMTGTAAALVHVSRSTRRIFVRHIHGSPFTATHRALLAAEAALLLATVAWLPVHVLSQRQQLQRWADTGAGSVPVALPTVTVEQWSAAGVLGLVTGGGALVALVLFHRRVLQQGSAVA